MSLEILSDFFSGLTSNPQWYISICMIFIPIFVSLGELIFDLKQPVPEMQPSRPYECKVFKIIHNEEFSQEEITSTKPSKEQKPQKLQKSKYRWIWTILKVIGAVSLILILVVILYINSILGKLKEYEHPTATDISFSDVSYSDIISDTDISELVVSQTNYTETTTLKNFDKSMIDIKQEDVMNILLIGSDTRDNSYENIGNTDSMILASINTRNKNIKITSFMRDMYVTIPGHGKNRLNAAFAYGGPELLFKTLKYNFDIEVDKYVCVNFNNFRKIINKVGGVDIELTAAEARYMNKHSKKYNTETVEAGMQTLDGNQALSYARCRKIDSDFGRTERQRKVILAFVEKIKDSNVLEINSLLNELLPTVYTNVSKLEILSLMVNSYSYLNTDIETLNIPIKNSCVDAKVGNMSVLSPNFTVNKKALKAHIYSTYKLEV